ncbi:MAG: WG repeat-containing protein [Candidatus Dadabacteria bacterium]|nr:WG repeat-containing protein [Candidatus Dadabacteria bacterium]
MRYLVNVDGKFGFIDEKGAVVIEPLFDEASSLN